MRRVAGVAILAASLGTGALAHAQIHPEPDLHAEQPAAQSITALPDASQPDNFPPDSLPPDSSLPDTPSAVAAAGDQAHAQDGSAPCPAPATSDHPIPEQAPSPCGGQRDPYQRFLNSPQPLPLTSRQKGVLAVRDVIDPFNILTIVANSAFTIGIDSHTAYGPGLRGFGRNVGYSFVEDATGEFIGTYAVCSLVHQDPHYHRDPQGSTVHRIFHAVEHTFVSQHDDGRPMLNIENLITYPASAEIENLYVPGVHGNGPSTVARIATGLATDPVSNLITEFLPDFARRVHIHVVFVQQILNQVATGQSL